MLMFFRLFSRAPCTRITSWLSATCTGDVPLVAMLVSLPSAGSSGRRGPHRPVHSGGITRDDLRNYAPGGAGRGRIPASPDPAARRPGSGQPAAVAHQLPAGQLVLLAPGLDPARRDAEPAVRRGLRARVEAGARGEPVAALLGQRVPPGPLDCP